MIINGYNLVNNLKTDNSGFSKWGFATRKNEEFFIKEFLTPVYPVYTELLGEEQVKRKEKICAMYEEKQKKMYMEINECSDGNIVRIEHFFRYGSKYYITMKKINTVQWSEINSFTKKERLKICKVLAHSIGCLHEKGIVHADIKLDNILLHRLSSGNFTAKIIDFDTCFWEATPPLPTEEIPCDLFYMAPETYLVMQTEEGKLTTAIDVFALGLIFHKILTGDLPGFDKEKYDYPFEALLNNDILYCDNTLETAEKIMLAGMLQKEPEKRISLNEVSAILFGDREEKTDGIHLENVESIHSNNPRKEPEIRKENLQDDFFYMPGNLL